MHNLAKRVQKTHFDRVNTATSVNKGTKQEYMPRDAAYQYFVVDTLCKRQPLEDLAEQLEHLGCVLCFHLSLEPIHLVHVVRLVVTLGLKVTLKKH